MILPKEVAVNRYNRFGTVLDSSGEKNLSLVANLAASS